MNKGMQHPLCIYFMFFLCNAVLADDSGAGQRVLPDTLKGVHEIYLARIVAVGWAEFNSSPDESKLIRNSVTGILYAPVRKIALGKPLESEVEKRADVKRDIQMAPAGHFIGYGKDGTIWLITMEFFDHFVRITRLKPAVAEDDPQFSKLYWEDWEEPRYKCQSRSLYDLLKKEQERLGPVK